VVDAGAAGAGVVAAAVAVVERQVTWTMHRTNLKFL
jgi:hypothetical protein